MAPAESPWTAGTEPAPNRNGIRNQLPRHKEEEREEERRTGTLLRLSAVRAGVSTAVAAGLLLAVATVAARLLLAVAAVALLAAVATAAVCARQVVSFNTCDGSGTEDAQPP